MGFGPLVLSLVISRPIYSRSRASAGRPCRYAQPPRLSGSFISRGLPNGSDVRECLSCRKTASCDLMDSTLPRRRLLKEMILHVLVQIAPYPNNSLASRARKLIRDHAGSRIG